MPRVVGSIDARGKDRVQTTDFGKSLTVQADKKKADIQEILKQYSQTGVVQHMTEVEGQYLDVSEFTDYSDMMVQLAEAEAHFMSLPSKFREAFDHDVAKWLDAAHDPAAVHDAMVAAGMADAEADAIQAELEAAEPPPAPGAGAAGPPPPAAPAA